ncbi:MAG: IS66 family insertion sequence element accessory protein TnpB [Planctomycetes bacterium]|nr:IS66 family insertion sequence element accessory protein TnpB [Planctomycetota bacterium]
MPRRSGPRCTSHRPSSTARKPTTSPLPTSVRIYLARGATDMRKSIDGLSAITRQVLEHDLVSGHLFVFCNARRDRIEIL